MHSSVTSTISIAALRLTVVANLIVEFMCDHFLNAKNNVSEPADLPKLPIMTDTALLLQVLSMGIIYAVLFPQKRHVVLPGLVAFALFFVATTTLYPHWVPSPSLPRLTGASLLLLCAGLYFHRLNQPMYVAEQRSLRADYSLFRDGTFWINTGVVVYWACLLSVLMIAPGEANKLSAGHSVRYWLLFDNSGTLKTICFVAGLYYLQPSKKEA